MTPLRPTLVVTLLLTAVLPGCGWFSRGEPATTLEPKGGYLKPAEENRVPVQQVTSVTVEQTLSGAIVRVTGLPPTQGWWSPKLLVENDGNPVDGVMTYRFLLAQPLEGSPDAQRVMNPESREVTAAAFIRGPRFAATHRVVVIGEQNSLSASR